MFSWLGMLSRGRAHTFSILETWQQQQNCQKMLLLLLNLYVYHFVLFFLSLFLMRGVVSSTYRHDHVINSKLGTVGPVVGGGSQAGAAWSIGWCGIAAGDEREVRQRSIEQGNVNLLAQWGSLGRMWLRSTSRETDNWFWHWCVVIGDGGDAEGFLAVGWWDWRRQEGRAGWEGATVLCQQVIAALLEWLPTKNYHTLLQVTTYRSNWVLLQNSGAEKRIKKKRFSSESYELQTDKGKNAIHNFLEFCLGAASSIWPAFFFFFFVFSFSFLFSPSLYFTSPTSPTSPDNTDNSTGQRQTHRQADTMSTPVTSVTIESLTEACNSKLGATHVVRKTTTTTPLGTTGRLAHYVFERVVCLHRSSSSSFVFLSSIHLLCVSMR